MSKPNVEKGVETSYGKSSAVSAYLGLRWLPISEDTDTDAQFAIPYAVNQFKVCLPEATRCWEDAFASTIEKVVRDVAAVYYVSDNVAINEIYQAVRQIINKSAEAYAHICDLWRRQNCAQVKDSQNLDLGMLFLQGLNIHQGAQGLRTLTAKKGDFNIPNSSWSRDVLACIKHLYLSEELRNVLEFLFGTTFKLQRDDATARFAILNPGLYENSSDVDPYTSYDTFKGYLNNMISAIDGYFATYPCLSEIMAQLGLNNMCSFDFTRDLSQQTLHVYEDTDGEIEAILYSAATGAIDYNNNIDVAGLQGIVSIPTSVSNYHDGELHVERRILINVVSIMNFLRKAIDTDDLAFVQVAYNHSLNQTTVTYFDTFQGQVAYSDEASPAAYRIETMMLNNMTNAMCDSIGTAAITIASYVNNETGEITSKRSLRAGLSDYYLNPGDILSVCAQASFNIVFAGSLNKDVAANRVLTTNVQATGNYSGKKNPGKRVKNEANDRKPNKNNEAKDDTSKDEENR